MATVLHLGQVRPLGQTTSSERKGLSQGAALGLALAGGGLVFGLMVWAFNRPATQRGATFDTR